MRVVLIVKHRSVAAAAGLGVLAALLAMPSAQANDRGSTDPVVPVAMDMAVPAGIAQTSITMGAVVGDVNGDLKPDLLLDHHGVSPAQLYVNNGDGSFSQAATSSFGLEGERLGCAGADVDGDGLGDFFCAQGGDHGTGIKRDELWMQGDGLTFSDQASARGVADPFGRGRLAVFLDANEDGLPDLFVLNQPTRSDGLPSPSRLYLNQGGGVFRDTPSFGLDLGILSRPLGIGCARSVDVNGDGFPDLLVCGADHLHLLVNQGGTSFVDGTAQYGVTNDTANDAILADVDGDGLPDLVEARKTQLVVRLQRNGVFAPASYTLSLSNGTGVAAGDVNGDGTPDLYVVQGSQGSTNAPDVMLLNASQPGTVSFVQMTIPETDVGAGQWAYPLDYDANGLTDFLVTNGQNVAGPLQLIAFFPPGHPVGGAGLGGKPATLPSAEPEFERASSSAAATACGPSFAAVTPSHPSGGGTPRVNALTGAARDGWAAGTLAGNTPLVDHWDGSAWTQLSMPPLGAESGLNGAVRIATNDAWIVGYEGTVDTKTTATEHWDGVAWTVQPSANPGPDGNYFTDVATTRGAALWSVGYQLTGANFQPLIERWDGSTGAWAVVAAATGSWDQAALMSVAVLAKNDAWAFGWSESGGVFQGLVEHWDGATWSVASAPQVAGSDSTLFLAGSADGQGGLWVVGYSATGSRYQSLAEHYDGSAWTIEPTVDPNDTITVLRSVTTMSANDAWAVGLDQDPTGLYQPLVEHWNGTSWSVIVGADLGGGDDAPLGAVASFSGTDAWAAGEGAQLEHACPFVVGDSGITPAAGKALLGESVLWQIPVSDSGSHSVTDASGLGLYDSGLLAPGSSYVTLYAAAGGYLVSDTATGHTAKANVPPTANPGSGPVGSPFTITWATGVAPTGFAYDVQVKAPGSVWTTWLAGTTNPSGVYTPTQVGSYQFRARYDEVSTHTDTLYSAPCTIVAT